MRKSAQQMMGPSSNSILQRVRYHYGIQVKPDAEPNRLNTVYAKNSAFLKYQDIVKDHVGDPRGYQPIDKSQSFTKEGGTCCPAGYSKQYCSTRKYLMDSGASFHVIGKDDLTETEKETNYDLDEPLIMDTASGDAKATNGCTAYVQELGFEVQAVVLEKSPPLLSMGLLVRDHGCSFKWSKESGPRLIASTGKTLHCGLVHNVPTIVPVISAFKKRKGITAETFWCIQGKDIVPRPDCSANREVKPLKPTARSGKGKKVKQTKEWSEQNDKEVHEELFGESDSDGEILPKLVHSSSEDERKFGAFPPAEEASSVPEACREAEPRAKKLKKRKR